MSLKHAITFDAIRFSALPDEETYQERLASYLTKMLQRIRNSWHVTRRRLFNVTGTSAKFLEEDDTTYQQRLASYLTKMLQRIRNV
jgi:CRP-like cAMP-binding protein